MIYLDNNATTRLDDEVLKTMLPYLQEEYGNASSIQHKMGRNAHAAVDHARHTAARILSAQANELYFTSGATEAISTVIKGVFERYSVKGKHIITCKTEHKAVLNSCESIEKKGAEITYLNVNKQGEIDLSELSQAIRPDTILVTLMAANNETGLLFPFEEIAHICQSKDVLFFCDATQYIGKKAIDLSQVPIDILCFSAHKFHGPKGIGALFIRRKSKPIQIEPLVFGGKQEQGLRPGTYPTANIVGLAKALEITNTAAHSPKVLRDYFEQQLYQEIEDISIHCQHSPRLDNTSNILFKHVAAMELMTKLPNIALASGSACVTGDRSPSHVLKGMQLSDEDALSSIRFSFSKYNTKTEIDIVIQSVKEAVKRLRTNSPIWQLYKDGLLD